MMNIALNILSIQWRELKKAPSFYVAIVFGILLFVYTGIFMDLKWSGNHLVAVEYVKTSEPIVFISQWGFGYLVILFCLCYTSGSTLILNNTDQVTSLIFSKPVSREKFFVHLVLGTTLLIMIPFILLHLTFWINFGIVDQIWSPYIWLSLIGIFAACLLIVSSISFFSLISGSGIFPTLAYCFLFPMVFEEKQKFLYPLSDSNIYKETIDFLDILFPSISSTLMFSGNIFTQQAHHFSIQTLEIPYTMILLAISFFLFKRKNL